jgi:NAD(P)-dependent dehydrogenase (short-subunit alcohol dehydrogenase family)
LNQKSIVIVGGTTGIGLSAAKAFVQAGARVVAVGLPDEHLHSAEAALGDPARVLGADATHPQTATRAIQTAVNTFGGCHGLYHVAGGSGRRSGDGPLHAIPDTGWEATLHLNLTSVFYSNRAATHHFLEAGDGGAVLNLASVLGIAPSPTHFTSHAYASAKAGIIGLTRSCAATYAPNNIRFNALAPGLVDTPMARRASQDPTIMSFIATKQPLEGGRIGRPDDLDAAAVYFMSDTASFVTGQVLAVDGGWSVSEGQVNPMS